MKLSSVIWKAATEVKRTREEDLPMMGGKAMMEAEVIERRSTIMLFDKTGSKERGIMDLVSM